MVSEAINVAEAAYKVGDESASQFSRVMNQQRLYGEYASRKAQTA